MEANNSCDAKGISVGELMDPTSLRKPLTNITNLSINVIGNDIQKNENNVLMSALAKRNLEVRKLQLKVAKIYQQNYQFARAHSQMFKKVKLVKNKLKVAHHERNCLSATLKVKNQELEKLKKFKEIKSIESNTTLEITEQPVENIVDASQLPSHKKTRLSDRKLCRRSQSLGPGGASITNHAAIEEMEENQRNSPLRLINLKAEPCDPSGEDLFEVEDVNFPICPRDRRKLNEVVISCRQEPASLAITIKEEHEVQFEPTLPGFSIKEEHIDKFEPAIPAIWVKEEHIDKFEPASPALWIKEELEDQFDSSLTRTLGGRPLRRAAVRVTSYKEMSLKTKLRR